MKKSAVVKVSQPVKPARAIGVVNADAVTNLDPPVDVAQPVRIAVVDVDAVTNLESLPVILTLAEVSSIYRLAVPTIRRALQSGTFRPRPWDKYPYRWRRDDVVADLQKRREEKRRAHGFASVPRRRPARATLNQTAR